MYAKVSKKGQVTIPKAIRDKLKIDKEGGVLFLVEDDDVKLKGVPAEPLNEIREEIKGKIADEAAGEGLSD